MKNIEILLMIDNSLDTIGGSETSTKIIIDGIKDDFTVGIIHPGNIGLPVKGVQYFPLTRKNRLKYLMKNPFSFIKYIWNVKKIISREKPAIIHTQLQLSFFIVALLRKFKLIPNNIQLIHTERGLYTKYGKFTKKSFIFL